MRAKVATTAAALAAGSIWHAPALANGFAILQQSPTSMGRSFAGDTAAGSDASTAFFNPAAMTRLESAEFMIHFTAIRPSVNFGDTGVTAQTPGSGGARVDAGGAAGEDPGDLNPGGALFVAAPATDQVWLGFSVTSPFGLALNYDPDYFGRYDSIETRLATFNFSPVVAVDLIPSVFSVGAGADVQYANATLSKAIPNPLAPGGPSAGTDGLVELTGTDFAVGFNVGSHLTLGATRIGAHYRSGMRQELDGQAKVTRFAGPLAGQNGAFNSVTSLDLPAIASLGVSHDFDEVDVRVLAETRLFFWDVFDDVEIDAANDGLDQNLTFNFRNSFIVSLGGEWGPTPGWTLRAGGTYDRTPTTNEFRSTTLPDADRIWLGGGVTYAFSDTFELDLAANAAIFEFGKVNRIDTAFAGTPLESSTTTTGRASLQFFTAAIGVRWRF